MSWDFLVDRADLHHTKVVETDAPAIGDGQARLRVDGFGFTANNITYAAYGDMIGYWNFFPAPATSDGVNWGRVPVWGFADVVDSSVAELPAGDRVYGYLPMSTELIIEPARVTPSGFFDASEHRAALPRTYNRYLRTSGDLGYDEHFENEQMLLRPLFFTSFLIDDFLDDNNFFEATTAILTSASSKTAFGTAHLLSARGGLNVVGLTSGANVGFVEGLDIYDTVLDYDQIAQIPKSGHAVLIDFAGNADVVRAVHQHLETELTHSAVIGGTHWDAEASSNEPLPGPNPEFFFAPSQIEKRSQDWGSSELEQKLAQAWVPFIERVNGWIDVDEQTGADAITSVYLEHLAGKADPSIANVLHP